MARWPRTRRPPKRRRTTPPRLTEEAADDTAAATDEAAGGGAAAAEVDAATDAAPLVDKGDVAWMMTASLLVLFMIIPGLALFYGGLVRSKNMLSVLMQCTVITAMVMVIWTFWGYSFAFGGGTSPFWGGIGKLFLAGVTPDTLAATFTDCMPAGIRVHRVPDDLRLRSPRR